MICSRLLIVVSTGTPVITSLVPKLDAGDVRGVSGVALVVLV